MASIKVYRPSVGGDGWGFGPQKGDGKANQKGKGGKKGSDPGDPGSSGARGSNDGAGGGGAPRNPGGGGDGGDGGGPQVYNMATGPFGNIPPQLDAYSQAAEKIQRTGGTGFSGGVDEGVPSQDYAWRHYADIPASSFIGLPVPISPQK